jgi:hypothetical protein
MLVIAFLTMAMTILLTTRTMAAADTWSFMPRTDMFATNALLDLRCLNEQTAGEHGWMQSRDGKLYVPGNPLPFRGWSAGLRPFGFDYSVSNLAYTARFYAKMGINQVREMSDANANIRPDPNAEDLSLIKQDGLEKLHRLVAAMKQEGIYVTYCPWWIHNYRIMNNKTIPGYIGSGKPFFWRKDLQELAKGWYRQILTPTNPYTGITLAQDPTLNIIELQNEENLLFYGLDPSCCDPATWRDLRRQFTTFVVDKYGSLTLAEAHWKLNAAERAARIETSNGVAMLQMPVSWEYGVWGLDQSPAQQRFVADAMAFITHLERAYNDLIARYIKEDLGYTGLILGGNWRGADNVYLEDLARWGTLPPHGDCIAYHQYSSSLCLTPDKPNIAGYAWGPGTYFVNSSILTKPIYIPTNFKRMRNVPMICTEMGLPAPNDYDLEGIMTCAAYGAMHDMDQITWLQVCFMNWGYQCQFFNRFNHNWPHLIGQFPAAALIFRWGYVREAPVVVYEQRAIDDIYQRKLPLIINVHSSDPQYEPRKAATPQGDPAGTPLPGGVDPLAFEVGAVEYSIADTAVREVDSNTLNRCIDRAARRVQSSTGELTLDYGKQLLTINSPCAQGAVGKVGAAGSIDLKDIRIATSNALLSLVVVSMDGLPLTQSRKMLVQAVTPSRLSDARIETVTNAFTVTTASQDKSAKPSEIPAGAKLYVSGRALPFAIDCIHATVTFKNRAVRSATALDLYGYARPSETLVVKTSATGTALSLPVDTYYTIVE